MTTRRPFLLAALIAAPMLLMQLGVRGLNEPDEGRCAGIASEMFSAGDWLVPRLYDHAHFNKPPLLYWLVGLCYRVGGVNEWTARAVAGLSALGTVLLTASLGARLLGLEKTLPSALLLLTFPLFFAMSQIIDYNMLLTLWVTLALWSAMAWLQDGRAWQRFLFYLAIALSFLTKGPVGLAIVALALGGYRLGLPKGMPWRPIWSWPLAAMCVALSVSWYVAVARQYPELWAFFLRGELYNRVFTTEHERSEPLLYYAAMLPLGILPWILPALRSLVSSVRCWKTDPASRLLASWIILPLVMFTISKSKMPTYVLPLLPALALLGARSVRLSNRALLATALAILAVAQGALAAIAWRETEIGSQSTVRHLASVLRREARPDDRIALVERSSRGLSFYLRRPVSVPLYKFKLQVRADAERVRDKDFDDPAVVFRWFDSTQRVFIVCSPRVAEERRRDAKRVPHELYRDSNRVLISNQ
jgi:4-amino-4-deoxy-L-arabinose transferase